MRIYEQAIETVIRTNAHDGDIILPFHYKKITDGICPTITTRPEGLKTAILIVENKKDGEINDTADVSKENI